MAKITIKAKGDGKLPLLGNPKRYVSTDPMVVDDHPYYRRAALRGDVEIVEQNGSKKEGEK